MPPETPSTKLEMFLWVQGELLGVPLKLEAEYRLGGSLRFRGQVSDGDTLALSDLVEILPLGDFGLPPGLPRLALEKVDFAFEPDSGAFALSGEVSLGLAQRFSFLGINFGLPQAASLDLSLVRDGAATTLNLGLNLPARQPLSLSGNLAWLQPLDGEPHREIQNDDRDRAQDLVSLSLEPTDDVALTLIHTELGQGSKTRYLTNLRRVVDPEADPPLEPAGLEYHFALNPGAAGFEFPFLKADAVEGVAGMLGQQITLPKKIKIDGELPIPLQPPEQPSAGQALEDGDDADDTLIDLDLDIGVEVGSIKFGGHIPVKLNLSRFALSIGQQGIKLVADEASLEQDLLGLNWTFTGTPYKNGFHYFTLVTKNSDYQLQLAPDTLLELAYGEISDEPIVFRVTDFVLSRKGITLSADVADDPVRLNGLDTRFRFGGSQLHIVENVIQDLTIAGSGALPPDLVGEAVADVALQFKQVQGGLRIVAGTARLRGNNPLDCRGTRFQFSIDALGLKFVYDQKFHLYFTLTGQARFVPNPSDDKDGPLALLPEVTLQLVDCPLTGDASVLAQHIDFVVELPTPVSFSFLGAYGFELRAIGFQPQAEKFGGRGAMLLSGQVMFAQGQGDVANPDPRLHKLYIGLPPQGETKPQVDMGGLPVSIKAGQKFKLSGSVAFKYDSTMQGFTGDGVLEIKGLPPIAAAFGFMRVRRDADEPWLRAWFIYLELRQISFQVPILEFYIREVGLGFGYRYTLVAIKKADEAGDLGQLIRELKVVSRTQGDLSKKDRWSVDLEEADQDPRWTIVLRAMISQLSAAPSPLTWDARKEEALANTFLFDAVIAVRSDLTFFMAVRGWLNTSYGTFVRARNANQALAPLVSGFVFLWPREKRFLAHLASNPGGHLGTAKYPLKPPLPPFVVEAVRNSQFSATLLIEPGLMHYELGWPNMLRWSDAFGPLTAEIRGGFIFRISTREMILGISLLARARLAIASEIDLGLVGASLTALAEAAYGARYIGLLPFDNRPPAMYGALGLELRVQVALALWIKIPLLFTTLELSFEFSFQIGFTAGLEVALYGTDPGLRGRGTISLSVMGHSLQFDVRLALNEGAVADARRVTKPYLSLGLEATDVETALPGATTSAMADRTMATASDLALEDAPPAFSAPGYSVFVLRQAQDDGWSYFVLLPRGQDPGGAPERGFLPVPPAQGLDLVADFRLDLPGGDGQEIQRFDPWATDPDDPWVDARQPWRAHWEAEVVPVETEYDLDNLDDRGRPRPKPRPEKDENGENGETGESEEKGHLTLRRYLRHAFLTGSGDGEPDGVVATGDPEPIYERLEQLQDPRVQNPSDSAFEAAVRGAVEQFAGSPFFKHDPDHYTYDEALEEAFRPDTTVYAPGGEVPTDETRQGDMEAGQQAHQVRGLVIHKLVDDLRTYTAAGNGSGQTKAQRDHAASSIPFQMGLVFRVPAGRLPDWLHNPGAEPPTLQQRVRPTDAAPSSGPRPVEVFNLPWTDFGHNPPRFRQVQHYTDANTIAIAWDLAWENPPPGIDGPRSDPEHHLQFYHVRRRPLDGRTPEVVYQVKPAAVLRRKEGGLLESLKPRFQVVDHFNRETLEQQAGLPIAGRSYLYTITPVDQAGGLGQPLSLVATRYPNEPPRVPADGQLRVEYRLPPTGDLPLPPEPQAVTPLELEVSWTEPATGHKGLEVPIDDYYLIFRREATLPIGSYGLDSSTQRARTGLLPTSNARPLPADVKILLTPEGPRGNRSARRARLQPGDPDDAPLLDVLRRAGVFPGDEAAWQPEAWRLYFQTVSANGVPSALAPVQLLLRVRPAAAGARPEERRPTELEWLPWPLALPLLPPEDQAVTVGLAHLPMPVAGKLSFRGRADDVAYQVHPRGQRCLRFRWNQGPSGRPAYPLALTAGYELLELDLDAHTTATYDDPHRLNRALRRIQEVQMLPAGDLWLVPGDTLSANEWEAWYASAVLRRPPSGQQPVTGATQAHGPWYSWRESLLAWPDWPGLTDRNAAEPTGARPAALHPLLQALVDDLAGQYTVELQAGPPFAPQDWQAFFQATTAEVDPYGWNVLQRFGLSVALLLRRPDTGQLLVGDDLLSAVQGSLEALPPEHRETGESHLHVELLFQPNRRVELEERTADAKALLGLLQLSLRPAILPVQAYRRVQVQGPAGSQVHLALELQAPCSLVDQADPAAGQVEVRPDTPGQAKIVKRSLTLPANGQDNLLLRSADLPGVAPLHRAEDRPESDSLLGAASITLLGPAGSRVELICESTVEATIRNRTDPADALPPLVPAQDRAVVRHSLVLPDSGRAILEIEGAPPPAVDVRLGDTSHQAGTWLVQVRDLAATDPWSVYFSQSPEGLAAIVAADAVATEQWRRFRRYAESLTPPGSDEPRIQLASDGSALKAQLAAFMPWARRFFDAAGPVGGQESGPWLATAYPRAASPAQVTPDDAGRLTYDHLLQDRWAHNYRYYVRPYDRYRLLWRSLLSGESLDLPTLSDARPDPTAGGLDVVLDRTQPVDRPLVLSSARLDPPALPGQPVAPGSTWEVIVARHPEQGLVERNQTLARQVAFRQVAFTLLRRFAYDGWPADLAAAVEAGGGGKHHIDLEPVTDLLPKGLPGAYPQAPDHLILDGSQSLDDALARSLDLPARIGNFQQGALVLQWEGLPFYYEYRLLLVAQTTGTVSPLNEVTQRDLEYRSPDPNAPGRTPAWLAPLESQPDGSRQLRLPLLRFWDSLPPLAQARWPFEAPTLNDDDRREPASPDDGHLRKPASLPDPEVIYQLLEVYEGNVEIQVEFYYDRTERRFALRQLGRRLVATLEKVLPPDEPPGDYILQIRLEQQNHVRLQGDLDLDRLPAPTRAKVQVRGERLTVVGVLDRDDLEALGQTLDDDRDRQAVAQVFAGWFTEQAFATPLNLEQLPDEGQALRARLDSPRPGVLRYHGVMTLEEARRLGALATTPEDRRAVARLYRRSAGRGWGGSEWRILTRRGGAAPSPTRRLEAAKLRE